LAASKVASFVWRSEEACKNRVLEIAAVDIVACFSRFRTKGALQAGDEPAAKYSAQDFNREEKRVARANPVLAVERETTDRDHAVDMRMMLKVLAPGVEHAQEADLRAEMLCVSRDREQSGGTGAEQEVVDDLLVLESQPRKLMWNGEDHMEITYGK
jgi:hypothetical protein